jgi:hypothetical protein
LGIHKKLGGDGKDLNAITIVENLCFMQEINKATSANYSQCSPTCLMSWMEQQLEVHGADMLIFPAFFRSQGHWLTFKLDLESFEQSYGE